MARDVIDVALDGSTLAIRFGKTKVALTKLEGGDNLKTEVVRRLGSQEQDSRTPGTYETDEGAFEMEWAQWGKLLPLVPPNGLGNFTFPILWTASHPEVATYKVLYDRVRIVGLKESLEASEKAGVVAGKLTVQQILRQGRDGVWRSLNRINTNTLSTDAQMLL